MNTTVTQALAGQNLMLPLVLVFVAVLLLLEGLYLLWQAHRGPQASHLRRRLDALSTPHTAAPTLLRQRAANPAPLQRLLQRLPRLPRLHGLERYLLQAGLRWTPAGLLAAALAALLLVAGLVLDLGRQPVAIALGAGLAAFAAPFAWVRLVHERRMARIERQMPDMLDLITRALRAGHAFSSGLKMAGDELAPPLAGELRAVHDEINFGVSLQQALGNLAERVPLMDMRYFTVAVLIQRDSGGNLTEVLTGLSRLIRERAKLHGRVRVLSSEGRLSAWILMVMPFALAGMISLLNPEFMRVLWTDPLGVAIVKVMLVLMALGALWLRRIVRLRV